MATGGIPQPHDPNSDKYKASNTFAPRLVNINQPVSLGVFRPEITNQMTIGSCAQFSAAEAVFTMQNAARGRAGQSLNAQLAHAGFMYERVRRLHDWFPDDTGSWPSDGLDMLMSDSPLMSRHEYVSDARFDYPDPVFVNEKPIDYLKSYRYIYVEDGNALELMHTALDIGCSLIFCMYWPDEYFSPVNGILPEGVKWTPSGGHAISGWGMFPDRGGIVGASNHWTSSWNTAASKLGNGFRAGDVGIPFSFFQKGENSPIFQIIAVSPESIAPLPEPQGIEFDGVLNKYSSKKAVITADKPLVTNLSGKQVIVTVGNISFTGRVKQMESDWVVLKPINFNNTWEIIGERVHVKTIE